MDPMDEIRQTFFLECEDLLQALMEGLAAIEGGDEDPETVNAIFRAVHSIKGGAGAFSLNELVKFAHTFETVLDEVRAGRMELTPALMSVFFRSADQLSDLVEAASVGDSVDTERMNAIMLELDALIDSDGSDGGEVEFEAIPLDFSMDFGEIEGELPAPAGESWTISFKPHAAIFERGNDPVLLLRALGELGELDVTCNTDSLADLEDIDTARSCLSWDITLKSETASEDDIREIFEFVEDDCDLAITAGAAEIAPSGMDLSPLPVADEDEGGSEEIGWELATPSQEADEAAGGLALPDLPEHDFDTVAPAEAETEKGAGQSQARSESSRTAPTSTVRVELDRVDRMINLIGELVINQSMLAQAVTNSGVPQDSPLMDGLDEFKRLTRAIQEGVMAIRAQPVKPLFQRMSRIVREAAAATGKSVRLVTEGEGTEVDKTVIERLSDPLTHMIRNAVDHGLEQAVDRAAAGKREEGTVRLTASHRSGRVIIEIADDGAGINRPRVREIAIEKGLIDADAALSEAEIDNLLFMPGFSTAKNVSNLSGRGVGMDVVKKAIQSLGGRVNLSSTPGKGTTFTISLPLTLAILDGMLVRVADQTKVVPLTDVVETLKLNPSQVLGLSRDDRGIMVRGEFVPLVDVACELGYRPPLDKLAHHVVVLTETEGGARTAFIVDQILDQRQVVIKGLEENYHSVPGIAAATILGNGEIALILDVAALATGRNRLSDVIRAA